MNRRSCDVLVVGGGGAALRAAIAAHEANPELAVVLVTKGALGKSGVTATACSDRMAFHAALASTEPLGEDAWRYHADDIYRIGGHVSDADLAQELARGGAEAFAYLDALGVPWARKADGTVDQFVTDGSVYARACYTGPYTANHIEAALVERVRQLPIRVIEHHMVGELLMDAARKRVVGVALVSQHGAQVTALGTKTVVIATGGAGRVFRVNVFPPDCTGDGFALAYRAGAELVNLEFIQIGLCSLDTLLACSGSMMRALPRLVNDDGDEFLPGYFAEGTSYAEIYATLFAKGASWPVSYREPSHVIDIAVAAECARGQRVYLDYGQDPVGLDLAALPEPLREWYTSTKDVDLADTEANDTPLKRLLAINQPSVDWLAERGVDLTAGDRVEIAPAIQHFQGGIKIRTRGETTVKGLYAAGEVAGGQHGANRPGGNALLDSQVFGRIAGQNAANYATSLSEAMPEITNDDASTAIWALFQADGGTPSEIRQQVQGEMAASCSVRRTATGLRALGEMLAGIARRGICGAEDDLAKAIEALNIVQAARLIARAALERDESRGPHLFFADDDILHPLPRDDARWTVYSVLRVGDDGPILTRQEPVRPEEAT